MSTSPVQRGSWAAVRALQPKTEDAPQDNHEDRVTTLKRRLAEIPTKAEGRPNEWAKYREISSTVEKAAPKAAPTTRKTRPSRDNYLAETPEEAAERAEASKRISDEIRAKSAAHKKARREQGPEAWQRPELEAVIHDAALMRGEIAQVIDAGIIDDFDEVLKLSLLDQQEEYEALGRPVDPQVFINLRSKVFRKVPDVPTAPMDELIRAYKRHKLNHEVRWMVSDFVGDIADQNENIGDQRDYHKAFKNFLVKATAWTEKFEATSPTSSVADSDEDYYDLSTIEADEAEPKWLPDGAGRPMIYPGKAHLIMGPPETYKSWLMLMLATQPGVRARYVDFENGAPSLAKRVQDMGRASERIMKRTFLKSPETTDALLRKVSQWARAEGEDKPNVVLFDGMPGLLSLFGASPNDEQDILRVRGQVIKPLLEAGIAVVALDHVTKETATGKTGSTYASGSIQKSGQFDVVLSLFVKEDEVHVDIAKDRPGALRARLGHGVGNQSYGWLRITDDPMKVVIEPWTTPVVNGKATSHRSLSVQRQVLDYLDADEATKSAVLKNVSAPKDDVLEAIEALLEGGYIESRRSKSGSTLLKATDKDLSDNTTFTLPDRVGAPKRSWDLDTITISDDDLDEMLTPTEEPVDLGQERKRRRVKAEPSEASAVSTRVSNGAGQEGFVGFSWGAPVEDLAGDVVDLFGDGVEVGLVAGDRRALGQVAADDPVGVLVGAAFPR